MDAPQRLLKLAQDFWGRRPLDVPAAVLHGGHVLEALDDLADVRLDLVAAVGPQDDQGRLHPPVAHAGQGSAPHLQRRGR